MRAWQAVKTSRFFNDGVAGGRIVATSQAADRSPPAGWAGLLSHPIIDTISYPYEWTFSMLRRAALLQLELMEAALAEDFILKDATPYNVQFIGSRPIFIDVGSFEPMEPGDAWVGYRQFCRQFLFPLMLRAYRNVPFQPWLRGDPEGLTASTTSQLLRWGNRFRPGVLTNVVLQSKAEQRFAAAAGVRSELKTAGFSKQLIVANVARLRKVIEGLDWKPEQAGWAEYTECEHVSRHRTIKQSFLGESLTSLAPKSVVDFGANDGFFSRQAAASGASVWAVDADEPVLEKLFLSLRDEPINTLLVDMANPTPNQGWALEERSSVEQRLRPDLIVCYAVVHHLAIARNIPLPAIVEWLRRFSCPVVFEFVGPEDAMVTRMTANKRSVEVHPGYDQTGLERAIEGRYLVARHMQLEGGTRLLYDLRPV